MFGADVQFNIGGHSRVTSVPGLVLTFILTGILVAYSFQRLTVMLYQKNPQIT